MAKKRKNITAKAVQANENRPVVPNVTVKPEEDNDDRDDDGLTWRMKAFVAAITGPAAGNATKAAAMAGYASENNNALRVTACRLLTFPNVAQAIAHAWARKRNNPEWTRSQIIDLASSSMANFESVDADGNIVTDFAKAAALGAIGQIKEIEETIISDGEDGTPKVIKRKLKLHDRTAALNLLARMQGLVSDAPGGKPDEDLPLEEHPATGRTKAPCGTAPPDEQPGAVQDSAGRAPQREDRMGETPSDQSPV